MASAAGAPDSVVIEVYNGPVTEQLMALLLSADPDERAIEAYLADSQRLIARKGDQIIGIALLTLNDRPVTNQGSGVASDSELANIAVAPSHRGRGYAKALIGACVDLARESGAKSMDIGTGNSSIDQIALYQKCGFRIARIQTDYFAHYTPPIWENGIRCLDRVVLSRRL